MIDVPLYFREKIDDVRALEAWIRPREIDGGFRKPTLNRNHMVPGFLVPPVMLSEELEPPESVKSRTRPSTTIRGGV